MFIFDNHHENVSESALSNICAKSKIGENPFSTSAQAVLNLCSAPLIFALNATYFYLENERDLPSGRGKSLSFFRSILPHI
jgi:hypothetical protein